MKWLFKSYAIVGLFLSIGCGGGESTRSDTSPRTNKALSVYTGTVVTASDGTRFVGDTVAVDVRKIGGAPQVKVSVLAFSAAELMTALMEIPPEQLPAGDGSARIAQMPMEPGIAYVERQRRNGPTTRAADGMIVYSLGGKHITMSIQGSPADVSSSLDATFQIRCWVPPGDIGAEPNGSGDTGAVQQLVLDEQLQSNFCSPYRQ